MTVRRGVALALGVAAALLLGGCSIEGTVTIESAQRVAVDITASDVSASSCDEYNEALGLGLTVQPIDGAPRLTCRFEGVVTADALGRTRVALSEVGEQLALGFDPAAFGDSSSTDQLPGLTGFEVRVIFPGPVLHSSGTVDGNDTLFSRHHLLEPDGLRVIGQGHAGPAWWLLALVGGALAGAGIGGASGWFLASRRPGPAEDEPSAPDGDELGAVAGDPQPELAAAPHPSAAPAPRQAVDESMWAPPTPDDDRDPRSAP